MQKVLLWAEVWTGVDRCDCWTAVTTPETQSLIVYRHLWILDLEDVGADSQWLQVMKSPKATFI